MVELFNNLFGAYEEQNTNRMSVLSKSDCSFTGINNRLMGLLFLTSHNSLTHQCVGWIESKN